MPKLFFMHREFTGHTYKVSEMLENESFRSMDVFEQSWWFLKYCFIGCDCICSETSSAVRTHLYNLAAGIYRNYESILEKEPVINGVLDEVISEAVAVAEYSVAFPICLWTYGDDTSRDFLNEWLAPMPTPEQAAHILSLPHMHRHERERLPYRCDADKVALKRFRNEQADFNRRRKHAAKEAQRQKSP